MSDLPLVRRILSGDEPATEAFFNDFFPRLYRFACLRLGGDEQATEEVVQATLIRAVRKLHTFRGEATLFTWLCTLCRREIHATLSEPSHLREVPFPEDHAAYRFALDAVASLDNTDPERQAHRGEIARLVHVTMDQLPGRYGVALELKYIQELSVSEIAERLDLSYKATESLLSRARAAFRDAFTELAGAWPLAAEAPLARLYDV